MWSEGGPVLGALATIGISALFLFALYRRSRRNFGRQRIRTRALVIRALVLSSVALWLAALPHTSAPLLLAAAICGGVLAAYALRLTRFEQTDAGRYYRPNSYIGAAITALFVGRLAYRTVRFAIAGSPDAGGAMGFRVDPETATGRYGVSITLLMLFVLVGYHVFYNTGILIRARGAA